MIYLKVENLCNLLFVEKGIEILSSLFKENSQHEYEMTFKKCSLIFLKKFGYSAQNIHYL